MSQAFTGRTWDALSASLSHLYHRHLAPTDLRVRAQAEVFQPMDLLAEGSFDRVAAMRDVPTLIKSYLRLGGFVGDGAFVDHQFNTTDVCLVMGYGAAECFGENAVCGSWAMSGPTWTSEDEPAPKPLRLGDWGRVILRGVPIAAVVFGGLVLVLLLRLIERPFFGVKRPMTPRITVGVCWLSLRFLGISYQSVGAPMKEAGVIVSNHASWMDILTLNSAGCLYFVAKSEVAGWPGIGWLARVTGTVFVRRDRGDAVKQKQVFEDRLLAGHRLLFFPEGTSTDGLRVLPFKPTLFAALFSESLKEKAWVQPVTVRYQAPEGEDVRHYAWWGDMELGSHLLQTLATRRHGRVAVVWHEPLKVADYANRKALAKAGETAVRGGQEALVD